MHAQPQPPAAPATATIVPFDLEKKTIGDVPFDKAFSLVGEVKAEWDIRSLTFEITKGRDHGRSTYVEIFTYGVRGAGAFTAAPLEYKRLVVPFLHGTLKGKADFGREQDFLLPDREYTIRVTARDSLDRAKVAYTFTWGFVTTTKFGDHTKIDFGVGHALAPRATFGYTVVNIYLTPINEETDLQKITSLQRNIFLRTSFFMGISPILFASDTKQPIKNKFATGNFVYGIGIRSPFYGSYTPFFHNRVAQKLLQPMRLNVGHYLFKQADANPLVTRDVNKNAFFMSLSYDINVAAILGPVGKFFTL